MKITPSCTANPARSGPNGSRATYTSTLWPSQTGRSAWLPPACTSRPVPVLPGTHTRPGQTVYVTEGEGRCQRRGGPIETIRPGDRVFFEPGEDHWHGAAPDRFMTHVAIQQQDESGDIVTWGEHVSDQEYNAPRAS